MKQTAVEWLLDNLISEPYSEKDFEHNKNCWDKAELMEKEQIKHAWCDGNPAFFDIFEQYYNETYGGNK
jgi:hypothetical protein